jgi:hypothetical protein
VRFAGRLMAGKSQANATADSALAHDGFWPDCDLPQRQLLGRLFGVERARYAQRELFRI